MAEVARWEASASGAALDRRWGWLRDRGIALRVVLASFLVLIAIGLGVAALWSGTREWSGVVMPIFSLLLAGGVAGEAWELLPHRRFRRRVMRRGDAILHPVRLTLLRDGVAYGWDDGLLRFEDGVLRYGGLGTGFRLRASDAALLPDAFVDDPTGRADADGAAYGNLATEEAWAFDLVGHPGVQVRFHPVPVPGRPSVCGPLFRWLLDAPPAKGASVLPPLTPRPGPKPPRGFA